MRTTRTARAAAGAAVAVAVLLTGCGNDSPAAEETPAPDPTSETTGPPESTATDEPSKKPRPQGPFVDITFEGDTATPNGERVDAEVGKPITLRITSDRPGELHVHSTPEQEIPFPKGASERKLVVDQPGVVDVEEHDSGLVLIQLEVR